MGSKKRSKRKSPSKRKSRENNMKTSKKTHKKTNSLKIITSPLNNAIVNGNIKKVKELLKKGANPNEFTNIWCSPKFSNYHREHFGIECGDEKIGCDCGNLGTSIQLSLFLKNKKISHLLLDHGVDVTLNHPSLGVTSLLLSVNVDINLVKKVFEKGSNDVNYVDTNGDNALSYAIWCKYKPMKDSNIDIIKFLVSKGADVNYRHNTEGWTPLELACKIGHINVIKYLLNKGANVNTINKRKRTPLHEAIVSDQKNSNCNKLQIVKLLIDNGAKVNTQSKDTKSSPLSSATVYGLTSIVKLLLSKGAKKNVKDIEKMTPLDIAEWNGFHSIVKLLK